MKIVIFDLETRMGPRDLSPDDEKAGWDALRNGEGGISALAIFDMQEDWLYLYDDISINSAASHIEDASVLVSFCGERFDVPCMEGVLGRKLRLKHHFDIYTEISKENARRGIKTYRGDFTLNAVCQRTLGYGKIGHGSNIGKLLQENRYGELFNYCGHDVKLTRDLLRFIISNGGVQGNNNTFLPVSVPDWISKLAVML
jgi:hypothetical protein